MDESVVAVVNEGDRVEENAASKPFLEVSVSFGRFENDLLSWEKWSTFSPNKYMDEVEKYSTPGSVAQKRAYFEAHYKKIADRKLLEQEKQMESDTTVADELNGGDLMRNDDRIDSESETSNNQVSAEEVKQTITSIGEVSSTLRTVVKDEVESATEFESSSHGGKEELDGRLDCNDPETNKQEEAVFVKGVETPSNETQCTKESPQKLIPKVSKVSKIKEAVKSNRPKESKKTTPVTKERNIASVKKKPVSSTAKAPHISTPKLSKTTPASVTPATRSVPRSSANKGDNSSLLRSRNSSAGEHKKVAPKSLHMSLSLGTPNSDPSSGTAVRRSFIMEKMGDKDIVKRAFKTFQKSFNQMKSSPGEEKSSVSKLVPAKEREARISASVTARKENGGLRKSSGTDSTISKVSSSQKSEEKSYMKAAGRMSLQSKSKVAPSQKLDEKFNAGVGGRTSLQSKSKVVSKHGLRH